MRKLFGTLKKAFIKSKEYISRIIKSGILGIRKLILYLILSFLLILFFFNIGALSSSMSKMSKVGGPEDWLSFFGAVLGSIVAIIGAYILTIISNNSEKKEKNKLAELIIKNFLRHEIGQNFKACAIEHVKSEFSINPNRKSFQFGFNESHISFEEFGKVKYELLKYDSDIIKHTLEVYQMFYTLSKLGDYKHLSLNQIQNYIDLYLMYSKNYMFH